MKEYYHYTSEKLLDSILKTGMWENHPLYTSNQYYNAVQAGQAVGVMPNNIDCVLLFTDDGRFTLFGDKTVPGTGRFTGGAFQYSHPGRPRPIAKRKITDQIWKRI